MTSIHDIELDEFCLDELRKSNEKIRGHFKDYKRRDSNAAPTNNVGGGKIAGTVEAGDDPPVRKRKKPPISIEARCLVPEKTLDAKNKRKEQCLSELVDYRF